MCIAQANDRFLGKACWEGFKKLEPKWREILDTHDEMLTASDTRSTISSRTRKFDALVGKLQSLVTNASEKDGFESMLVVCGNSIHEDTGLSHVFVSAGAENVCSHDFYSGVHVTETLPSSSSISAFALMTIH